MPRQMRWLIKRDLEQAIGNIETAEGKIATTGERFKGIHDNYYKAFEAVFITLENVITVVKKLKDEL